MTDGPSMLWSSHKHPGGIQNVVSTIVSRRTTCSGASMFRNGSARRCDQQLDPYYSEIGRPSVDPELMIRMLIVGYCYGLRSDGKLTQEVELHLAQPLALGLGCSYTVQPFDLSGPKV